VQFKQMGACAVLALCAGAAHAAWEEKYFNPKPLADDVVLPMPCDGSMVFRKVQIPLAGPLDDYPVTLGQNDDALGYLEHARPEHIAGSFTDASAKSARYYLLAKYELNELQYQAVMNSSCPKPSNLLRFPQVSLSWFEALAFADRYNLWLRKNALGQLPKEDGVAGFVRLPTEAEWEFAARGGLAVSESEFRDLRHPTPDGGLNEYAWFAGSQSANGKLQLVGLLKPNPLGLHDMLGNVDEMLFEPFRLNKLDRQHGQAGGFIVRGGNYLKAQAELRSALREEQPYYREQGEQRIKTTGVRLALVSPVLTSSARIQEVKREWQALGAGDVQAEKIAVDIQEIARGVENEDLKQQLENLHNKLRASDAAQDEQRNQAIRSALQLGVFLCTRLNEEGNWNDTQKDSYTKNCTGESPLYTATSCAKRQSDLEKHQTTIDFLLKYYSDSLTASAGIYTREQIEPQLRVTEQRQQLRGNNNLHNFLQTHWNNLQTYMETTLVKPTTWLDACKSTS